MAWTFKCPGCRGKFSCTAWPTVCPLCKYDTDTPDTDEISGPAIMSAKTKNNDKLYRDIERGSEVRAQMAADHLGVPVSEMSGIKITNLNDRRDAEIMAMPVKNAVTDVMSQAPGTTGFQANGAAFAGAVRTGPYPNAGMSALAKLQAAHKG